VSTEDHHFEYDKLKNFLYIGTVKKCSIWQSSLHDLMILTKKIYCCENSSSTSQAFYFMMVPCILWLPHFHYRGSTGDECNVV